MREGGGIVWYPESYHTNYINFCIICTINLSSLHLTVFTKPLLLLASLMNGYLNYPA